MKIDEQAGIRYNIFIVGFRQNNGTKRGFYNGKSSCEI